MDRFEQALARFDEENSKDPHQQRVADALLPRELAHARRLTEWVLTLDPRASEVLRLAARCQHICRWMVPRAQFPDDRPGYHRWRNHLKQFHADTAARILRECGYDEALIEQVRALNLKKNFPSDPESQTIEDGLCLVFLEFQFRELAARTDRAKMVNALRKSWNKMSDRGRALARKLNYSSLEADLLAEALADAPSTQPPG